MHASLENNLMGLRQEILDLLQQQMEVLNSPLGMTDAQLRECYTRQTRVQELREQLQMALSMQKENGGTGAAHALVPPGQPASLEQSLLS